MMKIKPMMKWCFLNGGLILFKFSVLKHCEKYRIFTPGNQVKWRYFSRCRNHVMNLRCAITSCSDQWKIQNSSNRNCANRYVNIRNLRHLLSSWYLQPQREKCLYSEIFWSVFSRIWIKYGPQKLQIRTLFIQWALQWLFSWSEIL